MQTPEEQLIKSALAGQASAFAELYDRYVQRIYHYHYYRTFHKETAEDLTSQTFVKALEHLKTFNDKKGSFSAWLYRIARNILIDHLRKTRPSVDIDDVWDSLADHSNLARDAEYREDLATIQKTLQQLPSEQRDMVMMRLWDELSYAEIAELVGKSEAACKMSYSRAIAVLRKQAPMLALLLLIRSLIP